jgi:hypothetical protein
MTRTAEATTRAGEAIFQSRLGASFGSVSERGLAAGSTVSTQVFLLHLPTIIRRPG